MVGYPMAPVDDLLLFHVVFGKTVPDISLNAVANLGYADCRFLRAAYPGDTLSTVSEVIGLKENSNGKTGTVYVRSTGRNQRGEEVLTYVRWVMVRKRDEAALRTSCACSRPAGFRRRGASGSGLSAAHRQVLGLRPLGIAAPLRRLCGRREDRPRRWHDGRGGRASARNPALPEHRESAFQSVLGVAGPLRAPADLWRACDFAGPGASFNGLANAFHIAAINGGRHVAPLFAGGTVYAWSEILDKAGLPGRGDVGALRIMTRATRDLPCAAYPTAAASPEPPRIILELDYWALIPI